MQKIIKIGLISILLISTILITSCEYVGGKAPAATAPVTITQYSTKVEFDALKTVVDTKASKEDLTSSVKLLQTLIQPQAAQSLTNYYTKTEVDAAIKKAVDDYKATIVGGTTNPSSPSGILTFSTDPVGLNNMWSSTPAGSSYSFTMRITNNTGQWHYVRPKFTFNVDTGAGGVATIVNACNLQLTYAGTSMGYTFNPTLPSGTTLLISFDATPNSGGNTAYYEYAIASGTTANILVTVQITSVTQSIWKIIPSIADRY